MQTNWKAKHCIGQLSDANRSDEVDPLQASSSSNSSSSSSSRCSRTSSSSSSSSSSIVVAAEKCVKCAYKRRNSPPARQRHFVQARRPP